MAPETLEMSFNLMLVLCPVVSHSALCVGMGKDIRDPAGMNDEELFEAFGLLDVHQQKLDKTELHNFFWACLHLPPRASPSALCVCKYLPQDTIYLRSVISVRNFVNFMNLTQSLNGNQLNLDGWNIEKRLPDMRETVATGNVHVESKPGLTAEISGNIKTLDLLLQLLGPGTELFFLSNFRSTFINLPITE